MVETQKHAEWNRLDADHKMYDSIYIACPKKCRYRENDNVFPRAGGDYK